MHERRDAGLRDNTDCVSGLIFEALARGAVCETAEHTGADYIEPDKNESDLISKRKRHQRNPNES